METLSLFLEIFYTKILEVFIAYENKEVIIQLFLFYFLEHNIRRYG